MFGKKVQNLLQLLRNGKSITRDDGTDKPCSTKSELVQMTVESSGVSNSTVGIATATSEIESLSNSGISGIRKNVPATQ